MLEDNVTSGTVFCLMLLTGLFSSPPALLKAWTVVDSWGSSVPVDDNDI